MTTEAKPVEKKEPPHRGVYLLPNLITVGSLFAGFYVIILAADGNFERAAWFILVSGVLDGLDGKVARLTGTTSKFGVELDSLADLVAFGVAPGVLMYTWALRGFGKLGWLAAFLFVVCGALRLARFNIQVNTVESKRFVGLPIPAAATIVATCVLLFYEMGGSGTIRQGSIMILIYILAFLMVSNVSYYSFKDPDLFKRQPFFFLVLGIVLLIVIVAQPVVMLFIIGCLYLISGPLWTLKLKKKNKHLESMDPVGDEDLKF
ncbi:CDP-diacylglycerol--serine O-phosphatidyltransferase [Geopsychrobacter electrodiphilus]|uniref:CDP-diacylglycerol--serine O-phosphatidyltransferase n=1 Tax=Geopsychrobacter electrodiphilus TaxID=225196 RepID=UPI00037641FD|nr:CDP-diacylglycerol--serine O-phosphatidyltransferase [Geopsychrobacter electrodiphilus]